MITEGRHWQVPIANVSLFTLSELRFTYALSLTLTTIHLV